MYLLGMDAMVDLEDSHKSPLFQLPCHNHPTTDEIPSTTNCVAWCLQTIWGDEISVKLIIDDFEINDRFEGSGNSGIFSSGNGSSGGTDERITWKGRLVCRFSGYQVTHSRMRLF